MCFDTYRFCIISGKTIVWSARFFNCIVLYLQQRLSLFQFFHVYWSLLKMIYLGRKDLAGGGGNGPPSSYQSEWLTADWTVYLVVPSTLRRTTDHIHQCVQIIILEKKSIISYRYVNTHFFKLRYFSEIWFFFKVRRMWSLVKLFQRALPHGSLFWKWCCLF